MKVIPKLLIFFLLFIILFKAVPKVSADIVFPECRWDEITASCECPHASNVCADNTCSQCLTYKNDPRYYYLWQDVYCRKGSPLELMAKFKYSFFIPLFITIVLQLIVFAVRDYRKKRELISVALINCASFFVGILFLRSYSFIYKMMPFQIPNIPFSLYGMDVLRIISLFIAGAVMTVFEIAVFVRVAKFGNNKRVVITVIIANIVSLVLGLGILNAVYPRFSQPRIF